MTMCDECGEKEARYEVETRVLITDLENGLTIEHPTSDPYEIDGMTDYYCEDCAKELGLLEE